MAVFQRSSGLANHYSVDNIDFNEPYQDSSAYGAFCKDCHTVFHGNTADADMYNLTDSAWVRHPTAGADISVSGSRARFPNRPYRVKVMSSTGNWGTQGSTTWAPSVPTDLTPSCFSCHKGHGNQNAFGLIFATGAAAIGEQGDGTSFKVTCQQCHGVGI